jgi:hypothetical protein
MHRSYKRNKFYLDKRKGRKQILTSMIRFDDKTVKVCYKIFFSFNPMIYLYFPQSLTIDQQIERK